LEDTNKVVAPKASLTTSLTWRECMQKCSYLYRKES